MNKRISLSIFSIGLATGILTLPFSAYAVQGDPIPGVDVSVEQSPSGIKVGATQTNATGIFTFGHLAPGQYVVKFTPPKVQAGVSQNYNSSKSNTAGLMAPDGSITAKITISLFGTEKGTPSKPISVNIASKGGIIEGVVIEGVPDESFLERFFRGMARFFSLIVDRVRHPLGGDSTNTDEATPTVSPTRSPFVTPTPSQTSKPRPQTKETPTPTQAGQTPTATSSPSTGSTSSTTATPSPSMTPTPTPTPNTDVEFISVYPKSVSSGQEFTINGTHFLAGRNTSQIATVKLNGVSTSFGVIDGQTIFATASGEQGTYDVSITTVMGKTLTLKSALTIQ